MRKRILLLSEANGFLTRLFLETKCRPFWTEDQDYKDLFSWIAWNMISEDIFTRRVVLDFENQELANSCFSLAARRV